MRSYEDDHANLQWVGMVVPLGAQSCSPGASTRCGYIHKTVMTCCRGFALLPDHRGDTHSGEILLVVTRLGRHGDYCTFLEYAYV